MTQQEEEENSVAGRLHPEALNAHRKNKGLTQEQLAQKSGCSARQISRWESGESLNVQKESREGLARALGVSWEDLTRKPLREGEEDVLGRVQLNVRVRKSTRTALEMVSLLYPEIGWRDIVELAPLLFLITAQQSLATRRRALKDAEERIDEAVQHAYESVPYMRGAFYVASDDKWLENERKAIKERKILQSYYDDDGEEMSPFVEHLRRSLEQLSVAREQDAALDKENTQRLPFPREWDIQTSALGVPQFEFPEEWIKRAASLSGNEDHYQELLNEIQSGNIDLRKLREKKEQLETSDYKKWLKEQHEAIIEESFRDIDLSQLKLSCEQKR